MPTHTITKPRSAKARRPLTPRKAIEAEIRQIDKQIKADDTARRRANKTRLRRISRLLEEMQSMAEAAHRRADAFGKHCKKAYAQAQRHISAGSCRDDARYARSRQSLERRLAILNARLNNL